MRIIQKNIYEVKENGLLFKILILFDISGYHYVGLKICDKETQSTLLLNSINKYVDLYGIREYSFSMIKKPIYVKGKPLQISNDDLLLLYDKSKESIIQYLDKKVAADVDGVTYLKWCKDKFILNNNYKGSFFSLRHGAIYWVNMGYGVGSEIRKIRPAIVWRVSKDKSMCTLIPLTSKRLNDKYYFHYDLTSLVDSTARIENMMNFSTKRILSPYYVNNTLKFISNDDKKNIVSKIERYYLFK